jgi:site-specific recombinase XerC
MSSHAPRAPDTPNPRHGASPTLAEAARLIREAVRDKSYQLTPIGADAAGYLRAKRKRLTDSSYRDYESCLDKLARHSLDLQIEDFEPPTGTERIEEFLDALWGSGAPRTYNKNLSIIKDFFRFQIVRGRLHGDPTLLIERARSRQVYRTTFSTEQRHAIISEQSELCDRIALRLLLDYGLRKGALKAVQFKHFDHQRRRLTIFTKGQKVRELPIPHAPFWLDLERHILEVEAKPDHYLMPRMKGNGAKMTAHGRPARPRRHGQPEGRPEAARPRLDPDDRRHLRRLGHRPARRDDGRRAGERR